MDVRDERKAKYYKNIGDTALFKIDGKLVMADWYLTEIEPNELLNFVDGVYTKLSSTYEEYPEECKPLFDGIEMNTLYYGIGDILTPQNLIDTLDVFRNHVLSEIEYRKEEYNYLSIGLTKEEEFKMRKSIAYWCVHYICDLLLILFRKDKLRNIIITKETHKQIYDKGYIFDNDGNDLYDYMCLFRDSAVEKDNTLYDYLEDRVTDADVDMIIDGIKELIRIATVEE